MHYSQIVCQQTNIYVTLQIRSIHLNTATASPWKSFYQNSEMWFIPLLWCEKDKRNLNTAKGVYNTPAYMLGVSYQQCKW